MQKQPYPYCKHGTYVGGCGVDHMCHACEMGDPEPTPRELLQIVVQRADDLAQKRDRMAEIIASYEGDPQTQASVRAALAQWDEEISKPFYAALRHFENIARIARGMDDDKYLDRLYEKHMREWNAMGGEDQFWSLPDHVLEGA